MSNEGKSIMELLREAPVVDYDPTKGVTIEEMFATAIALDNQQREREKNGWKPEYLLGRGEAENLPLWQLQWLGENYRVLTSLENSNIVKDRETKSSTASRKD